jgi:plastocyanin
MGAARSLARATLACALGLLCAGAAGAADTKPVTHTVVIEDVAYAPATLTVNRGDTVVWDNKDPFPHTVTAAGAFDSREIAAGKTWKYTARRAGDYAYVCTLHPSMRGTLIVK